MFFKNKSNENSINDKQDNVTKTKQKLPTDNLKQRKKNIHFCAIIYYVILRYVQITKVNA
jgi:hypothetical protein